MSASSRTARAPAKLNLGLRVGPPGDDGYHQLATVFHAVDLDDQVTALDRDDDEVTVEVADANGRPVPGVPQDATNLAVRAARLLRAGLGHARGVHLRVRKEVPVAGGMAGGSADAAAALVACAALWDDGLDPAALQTLAARLGSDVPFALLGGTAVGTGRGHLLEPVAAPTTLHWVVAVCAAGLSTPQVYARLDELRGDGPVSPPQPDAVLVAALRAGDVAAVAARLHNDLEAAALDLRPELADVLSVGLAAGAHAGVVSGSGPTVALLVDDDVADPVSSAVRFAPGVTDALRVFGPAPGAALV